MGTPQIFPWALRTPDGLRDRQRPHPSTAQLFTTITEQCQSKAASDQSEDGKSSTYRSIPGREKNRKR